MDQEVPGSRPGGGTITFNSLALFLLRMPNFKPDIEPDRCARHTLECRYRFADLRIYIRPAPAGLCVAATLGVCYDLFDPLKLRSGLYFTVLCPITTVPIKIEAYF